jgi:tRNA/tmRNA/rRNA uracil-C5-methylase (TrmA/RlmC/RlmD family)
VSCDPVSLARDVALLADAGYVPERVEAFDLFPNTHHVETVTRFVSRGS